MNNTKKLTTGAMLLAIVGALMLIDRQLSFMFETIIIMFMPVVIIIYSTMYELREGIILSVSLLILTFILGDPEYAFVNVPIAVIVGLGYSFGIKKNYGKRKLMIIAMILFVIGEIVVAFIISPLLGISIPEQIASIQGMYNDVLNQSGLDINTLSLFGVDLTSLILVMLVLSTILLGVMEGFIIHLISLFLLNRFKIKTIENGAVFTFNLNPIVAYICFISFASIYFVSRIDNETIKLIVISLSMIGSIILFYFGYIYLITYLKLKTGRKSFGLFIIVGIILLFPVSMIVLVIIGFLYGSGPLKNKLANLGATNNNEEHK